MQDIAGPPGVRALRVKFSLAKYGRSQQQGPKWNVIFSMVSL